LQPRDTPRWDQREDMAVYQAAFGRDFPNRGQTGLHVLAAKIEHD
jgi:hypothetical protein